MAYQRMETGGARDFGEDAADVRVEDIMTALCATVTRGTSVRDAARVMRDRDVGFLPVCEPGGHVLGVLTDRDLVLGVLAADRPVSAPVEEVMTPDPVVCHKDDDLRTCERLMSDNRIGRLLVLGDEGRLVGIVSVTDLAQVENDLGVAALLADVKIGDADTH